MLNIEQKNGVTWTDMIDISFFESDNGTGTCSFLKSKCAAKYRFASAFLHFIPKNKPKLTYFGKKFGLTYFSRYPLDTYLPKTFPTVKASPPLKYANGWRRF